MYVRAQITQKFPTMLFYLVPLLTERWNDLGSTWVYLVHFTYRLTDQKPNQIIIIKKQQVLIYKDSDHPYSKYSKYKHPVNIKSLKEVIKKKLGLIIESLCNNLLPSPWMYPRCAQNSELWSALQQHCPLLNTAFASDKCSSLPSIPLRNLKI